MVNISEELKNVYKNDAVPLVNECVYKELSLYFPELDITIKNDQMLEESMVLNERLCSSDSLSFGACEASFFKITLVDVDDDLKGKKIIITQKINDEIIPLGEYIVTSIPRKNDEILKEISAYDKLGMIDIDVSEWFNNLDFTNLNLGQFRSSLLSYLGIAEDTSALPLRNDNMKVEKTIEPSQISALAILVRIEELNGCFGQINRNGQFTNIILPELSGDYPTMDYPITDYPSEENNEFIYADGIINVEFEDYVCKGIDKLQIRQEENDIGCIVGEGTNTYVIEGNFLVYGKSHEELTVIANNIVPNIFGRKYRPYTADALGMPFVEVGDVLKFNNEETIRGYVLSRTLKGIHALRDEFSASGTEELEQNFGVNKEIVQLQGKATKIEKTVDEVKVTVEDTKQELQGEIQVLAGQVVLKVDTAGNIGYVTLEADPDTDLTAIRIKADNISLEGLVTVNGNFKILENGTLEAVNAKFSGIVEGSQITGSEIEVFGSSAYLKSSSWDGSSMGIFQNELLIQNGSLKCARTMYLPNGMEMTWGAELTYNKLIIDNIDASLIKADCIGSSTSPIPLMYFKRLQLPNGYIQMDEGGGTPYLFIGNNSGSVVITNGDVSCNTINNSAPITASNKNSYTFPPSSHTHNYATSQDLDNLQVSIRNWVNANYVSK